MTRAWREYDPVPIGQDELRQIIALGGHTLSDSREDMSLSRYILDQAAAGSPRVCFLSQANGEDASYVLRFYRHFQALGAQPADLSLFQPHTADIESFLMAHDAIYVGAMACVGRRPNIARRLGAGNSSRGRERRRHLLV